MSAASHGAELFAEQLRRLDIEAVVVEDWVEFDFDVPGGTFANRVVRLAIKVPSDFPTTPPSGIDFQPRLRPVNTGGNHPARSHSSRRFGNDGEYWSRPYKAWNTEKDKTAVTYMAWVRHLWMTT